jgi:hypothetical protein
MRVITDTGELPSLDTIILQGRGELNLYNQTLRFKPGKDYTHPDFNIPIYNPSTQTYDFTWVNRGPYVALVSPRDGSVGTPVWSSIGLEYIDKTLATAGDVITFDGLNVVWSPGGGGGGGGVLVALPFTTDHIAATNNPYLIGDIVYYLGNVYRCIANNDSILPTSALYWTNLGAGFPLVQQPADWNSTSGNNQILNKPTIGDSLSPLLLMGG